MKNSLKLNSAVVALMLAAMSACSTANKVQITDADWNDVNFAADRLPANAVVPVLKSMFDNLSTVAEKEAFLKFIARKAPGEFADLAVAIKGGRSFSAEQIENFGKLLQKSAPDGLSEAEAKAWAQKEAKKQENFFVAHVAENERYMKLISGDKSLMSQLTRIRNEMRVAGTVSSEGRLVKTEVSGSKTLVGGTVANQVEELTPSQFYKRLVEDVSDPEYRKAAKEYVEQAMITKRRTGVSVFDPAGCASIKGDAEALATVKRELDDFNEIFERTGMACGQTYAYVAVNNQIKFLGRTPTNAVSTVANYQICGLGAKGTATAAESKLFIKAAAEAEQAGNKVLDRSLATCANK